MRPPTSVRIRPVVYHDSSCVANDVRPDNTEPACTEPQLRYGQGKTTLASVATRFVCLSW